MTVAIAACAPIRRVTTTCNELASMGAIVRTQDGRVMLPLVYPPMPAPRAPVRGLLVASVGVVIPSPGR